MATNFYSTANARPATSNSISWFSSLRRTMQRWNEEAHIRAELATMTTRELADLGLNASDINDVARGTYRRGV